MSTAIDQALAAAETAAASTTQALAVQATAASAAVPTVLAPGRRITTDDVIGSMMNVDSFIKFSDTGQIGVGEPVKYVDKLVVSLSLAEIGPAHGIRYGNPAVYVRTRDGVTTDKGQSWDAALANARRVEPTVQPYNSWDLPFTLLAKAGDTEQGSRVGYTTVWSSFKAFHPVYISAKEQFGADAVVKLEITCKGVNRPGKKYGEAQFALLGQIEQD